MPKRKTNVNQNANESPAKRRTRSTIATGEDEEEAKVVATPTRKRGRPPGIRGSDIRVSPTTHPPTNGHATRRSPRKQAVVSNGDEEVPDSEEEGNQTEESDELNLSPRKKILHDVDLERILQTPQREVSRKRVFLHSVEISTPSRSTRSGIASARPSSPSPAQRRTQRRVPKAGPSTPRKPTTPSPSPNRLPSPIKQSSRKQVAADVTLPRVLPAHLHDCLTAQKLAVLVALRNPPVSNDVNEASDGQDRAGDEMLTLTQLSDLLTGTVERGEGNSCLVIGPRGSGKTRVFQRALSSLSTQPIVIQLNGHVHHNDRLAMRDIARQVTLQSPQLKTSESQAMEVDCDNPFLDDPVDESDQNNDAGLPDAIPSYARLSSLISALPTLSRPVVVVLDGFEMFTSHARQALLYCLLDTVQSCRATETGTGPTKSAKGKEKAVGGLAVIGLTPRVDVMNLLEKRVKSRFSHRILLTGGLNQLGQWNKLLETCLCADVEPRTEVKQKPRSRRIDVNQDSEAVWEEWRAMWSRNVQLFLHDRSTQETLRETFDLTRDLRILIRIMSGAVLNLSPSSPFLSARFLQIHSKTQRNPPHLPRLSNLSYPAISLLIAAEHSRISGNDIFTFEMLHQSFRDQVRVSSAAPVKVQGGGIGMVNVPRWVLFGAFEQLVQVKIFRSAGAADGGLAREFVKFRCMIEREDVKGAVETIGQTNLKKWLNKAR